MHLGFCKLKYHSKTPLAGAKLGLSERSALTEFGVAGTKGQMLLFSLLHIPCILVVRILRACVARGLHGRLQHGIPNFLIAGGARLTLRQALRWPAPALPEMTLNVTYFLTFFPVNLELSLQRGSYLTRGALHAA